jgi:hypothetical protein
LAGNEEGLRSPEIVWLFDGLAMEDMISKVREKKKKKEKKKPWGLREGEAGLEGEAGRVFCSHFKLVYFFLDVEVSNYEWKAEKSLFLHQPYGSCSQGIIMK